MHNSDFIWQTAREPRRRNSLDPRNDSVDATLANEIVRFGSVYCTQSVGVEDRHKANMSRRVLDLAVRVKPTGNVLRLEPAHLRQEGNISLS